MQIIVPHTNTDLDALGAAIGAQVLYAHAKIVLPGMASPQAAAFISLHRYNLRILSPRDIDQKSVTRVIVVDTADPARLGALREIAQRSEIHLFDHHPSDPGDLTGLLEVRDLVGATCTLIAELIEESGKPITPLVATAMLLGIYADTGSLALGGTTARDARAAAFLIGHGANLAVIRRFVNSALLPPQLELLHQLQQNIRWYETGGARLLLAHAETADYVSGLALVVHQLRELHPAPALFVAVQMGDRVHLVGRSEVDWIDASRALTSLGGGGHPTAASAVIKDISAPSALLRLESALTLVVGRPLMARDLMSSPVKSIPATTSMRKAEHLMLRYGHTGLPVVSELGDLIGVISLRDIERARRHELDHGPVKGSMMHRVVTVTPDTTVEEVQRLMIEKDIGRVPVLDGPNMVGIITRSDLLGLLYGGMPPRWHTTIHPVTISGATDVTTREEQVVVQALSGLNPGVTDLLKQAGIAAAELGVSAFVVGGFVRDLLLGHPNLDLDIVIEGDGIAFAHHLQERLGGVVKPVPRFGTAHLLLGDVPEGTPPRIDLSTARKEFYEHAASLPLVELSSLREDLYRRDFSINSMALRLTPQGPQGLVDFFGGAADLSARIIRVLHNFSCVEDPTRILRGIRFAERYGFQIESQTEELMRDAIKGGYLGRVTIERLRNEFILLLGEPHGDGAIALAASMGVLDPILPGFRPEHSLGLVGKVDLASQSLPEVGQRAILWVARLLALLQGVDDPLGVTQRLKLRREHLEIIARTIDRQNAALALATQTNPSPSTLVRAFGGLDPEGLLLLCALGAEFQVRVYTEQFAGVQLAISGDDLLTAGVPFGPMVGRALERTLYDRLDGHAPDRAAQLERALRYATEED